jgi:predicted RNA-binding Zn-ribbon protein involved in translation (DUF1610 family)
MVKPTDILFRFAKNNNGDMVHISSTLTGVDYYCPECNSKFIVRKGKKRRHHFAHNNASSSCTGTGEGYLHKTFKKLLLEYLRNNLINKSPVCVNFLCNICDMEHKNYDILAGILDIETEYYLLECRPDLALINSNGKASVFIEIVVTHEPEENVINYCKKNKITLVKIKLDKIEDLENVEHMLYSPTSLTFNDDFCPTKTVNSNDPVITGPLQKKPIVRRPYYSSQVPSANNLAKIILAMSARTAYTPHSSHETKAQANSRKRHFAIKQYYKNKK